MSYHDQSTMIDITKYPYFAKSDGSIDISSELTSAITAANNANTIYFPAGIYKISSNITFPINVAVYFDNGAILSPDFGITIILPNKINADLRQKIFNCGPTYGKIDFARGLNGGNPPIPKISPFWWGATGDSIHDDGYAIQAALDIFSKRSYQAVQAGTVFFPQGTYNTTIPLILYGNVSASITLEGEAGGLGPSGSWIRYNGPAFDGTTRPNGSKDGYILTMQGVNQSEVRNITFDGNNIAKVGVWIRTDQIDGYSPSNAINFRKCVFYSCVGTDSCLLQIGEAYYIGMALQTLQAAEVNIYNCTFGGTGTNTNPSTTTYYAWRSIVGGNVKDFAIYDSNIGGVVYGVDWQQSSGTMICQCLEFGTIFGACFRLGAGNLKLNSIAVENAAGGMFLDSAGAGGGGVGSLSITDSQIVCYMGANPNHILIRYPDHITMIGNLFDVCNFTQDGYGFPPVIECGTLIPTPYTGSVGVVSINNFYNFATDIVSVINSGNSQTGLTSDFAASNRIQFVSIGDSGGSSGYGFPTLSFNSYFGAPPTIRLLGPYNGSGSTAPGIIINRVGEPRISSNQYIIPYTVFATSAGSSLSTYVSICQLKTRCKVLSVVCSTTTAFAGPAGTISLKIGYYDFANWDNYILSHDVKTAPVVKGLSNLDLGNELERSVAVQGGGWAAFAYQIPIYATMISSSGFLNTLSQGSITIDITTEQY